MTDTTETPKSFKPTHRVWAVTKRANADKADWIEIGAAWANRDGKGFNLKLNLLPMNGADIVVRLIEPSTKNGHGPNGQTEEGGAA